MYTPPLFQAKDEAILLELCQAHPFGMIVAADAGGAPEIAHLPLALMRGADGQLEVLTHVARANPLAALAAKGAPMTAVFLGPHGYVSPTWYAEPRAQVPTWNYAVVHAHGTPQVTEDRAVLHRIVSQLTTVHESPQARPWAVTDAPPDYIEQMLKAIVGIELPVQRWVAKFKLSQNHPVPTRQGVVAGLTQQHAAHPVAALMQAQGQT
jgi:transcriptional regulator